MNDLPLGLRMEWFAALKRQIWDLGLYSSSDIYGQAKSVHLGGGMEFSQYRPYGQGDDIRSLDWKAYARTEKFFVRQSEIEKRVKIGFILDLSFSMLYEESGISKFTFARQLVALLAWVADNQGNSIYLISTNTTLKNSTKNQWHRLLFQLSNATTSSDFSPASPSNSNDTEVLVVVSDLFNESFDWQEEIKKWKTSKKEVIVLHLLSEFEQKLNIYGTVRFKSLENNGTLAVQVEKIRESYQQKITVWQKDLQENFTAKGIRYLLVDFTNPVIECIPSVLNSKQRLK